MDGDANEQLEFAAHQHKIAVGPISPDAVLADFIDIKFTVSSYKLHRTFLARHGIKECKVPFMPVFREDEVAGEVDLQSLMDNTSESSSGNISK